jgi:hypothetical protein
MLDRDVQCPEGQSQFLFDSALVDVLHRLGFDAGAAADLEFKWWTFGAECPICPDDLASRLMKLLPWETHEEAEKRRTLGRMGVVYEIGKLRRR